MASPPQAYRLQSRPRGLALVLSNVHFTGEKDLDFRSGGDVDHSNLVTLFKLLGYDVHVLLDQTAQVQMQNLGPETTAASLLEGLYLNSYLTP